MAAGVRLGRVSFEVGIRIEAVDLDTDHLQLNSQLPKIQPLYYE